MTLSVSPALAQVEAALKVSPGSFAKNNYRSVFDVARTSRKQFIAANMAWLGLRGGRAWDLAVGQAQHIRRLFREKQLTRQIRQSLPHTLSGQQAVSTTSSGNIQGLVQDGPTWQNQFAENWQAYCQSGAPEAVDSPVSYLAWLYKQAMTFEEEIQASSSANQVITLAERRPDLATLTVDNDAVNQQIPALQLVNEILKSSISTVLPDGQSVDETLAKTRYPTLLPYHFPHDQVELSLQNADLPLEDIISQTATDWPWFLSDSWQGARSNSSTALASRLAPEQQTLVTEPDNSTASDLMAFYTANLGLATADYTAFEDIDSFTHQLGITVPQAEELVAVNGEGSTSVVISPNIATFYYDDLVFTGAGVDSGRFGNALSLYNRQDSYVQFIPGSGAAKILRGDSSFSISMWINISAQPTDNQIPIICNCLMDGGNQGIRLCLNGGDFLLGITDSNKTDVNENKKKNDGTATTVVYNQWYLVCLTWDKTNKKAAVYYQAEGESAASIIEVDASTLTGDITTAEGFTWVLNDAGDVSYYSQHPEPATLVNCLYDDIGIFAGVLAEEDFSKIFSAGIQLSELTSSLSITCEYYYSLTVGAVNNVIDSSCYGANFINKGKGEGVVSFLVPDVYDPDYTSADTGSNPIPLTLSSNGLTSIRGKFNIGLRCDATQQAEMYLDDNISTDGSSLKNFTLAFWCKIPADVKNEAVVITNKTETWARSTKGITLFVKRDGSSYTLELTASDGSNSPLTLTVNFNPGVWTFVAIRYSGSDKLDLCGSSDGETMNIINSIDLSSLGSIALSKDYWGFNGNKDNHYYNSYPERRSIIDYDDITSWDRGLRDDEIEKFITSNKPAAGYHGMYHYYALDGMLNGLLSGLSNARMDRINRMVRLQRWLGLSYEETDLLISACIRAQGANNTDFTLNTHTLRALGVFRHWQQRYGISAFQFAAVLDIITPYAISPAVPFFDQVFNAPSLFDTPFTITGESVSYTDAIGDGARTVRQLCAGLNVTQAQFRVLADRVAAEQGDAAAKTFPLTLEVVSALYRLVMVPRWLGLSFADGAALLSLAGKDDAAWSTLAGVPQLAALSNGQPAGGDILDLLMALEAAAAWATDHKLSWMKNYLALEPKTAAPGCTDLEFSSTTLTNGRFGQGIQTNSADDSYFYFHPYGKVAQTMKGDKSFTLGFWLQCQNIPAERIPLFSNAGDANAENYSSGFSLSNYNGGSWLAFVIADKDKKVISKDWNDNYWLNTNVWYYVSLSWNAEAKTASWYFIREGSDVSVPSLIMDVSTLGDITTAEGFTWAFNTRGDLTREIKSSDNIQDFIYDDIVVFNGALTAEDINIIVSSGKSVAETDLSALSVSCIWSLRLQPTLDALVATAATVNFVNGIKQQLPAALLSEQSFSSVPLPASSAAASWLSVFPDLIDSYGLVQVAATDYRTIAAMVDADITSADITFTSDADREQAVSSLSGIINQARVAQSGIADSALAQMFNTAHSLPAFLLAWAGDSEYRLLADSLAMNSGAALTDPSQVPAAYLTRLFALGQRAGVSSSFNLTAATLSEYLAHPDWFGVNDTTLTLTLLYRLSRYTDWLGVAGEEDRVLGYLAWVNGTTAPDATLAAEALAQLLAWESSEVADATAGLPGGLAKTVPDVDYVMRLQQLSAETGLSVMPLLATGELMPGGVTETWDAWHSAGESLVAAQNGQQ